MRKRGFRTSAAVVGIATITAFVAAGPASADPSVFILDGAGGTSGRTTHAIGFDTANAVFDGSLFVFSHDESAGNLRVGRRTDAWRFTTLDGAGGPAGRIDADVGSDMAAASFGGALHVVYSNDTHGDLRHAWLDGATWRFETLDGAGGGGGRVRAAVGTGVSLATSGGALHTFYVDRTHTNIRLARFDGTAWSFQTLDGAGGPGGRVLGDVGYNTRAAVFGGLLHVFYFFQDPTCDPVFGCRLFGTIRQAKRSAGGWSVTDIRNINCCFSRQSLAWTKVTETNVFLFYENFGAHGINLRYLHWEGASWGTETPNGMVEESPADGERVGSGASAVTFDGRPYVFYLGENNNDLPVDGVREASWNGSSWDVTFVGVGVGYPTSSRVQGARRLVFMGDATIAPNQFGGHNLVQARLD